MYAVDRAISAGSSELEAARHEQTLEVNLVLRDFYIEMSARSQGKAEFPE